MPTPPAAGARPALPRGSLVALLTPFTDDLRIDLPTLRRQGVISVLANILPAEVAALCAHMDAGRLHEARALFMESSPGPAKYAAQLRGLCGGGARRAAGQAGCLIALPKK